MRFTINPNCNFSYPMNRNAIHLNVGFCVGFFSWLGTVSPVYHIRFLISHSAIEYIMSIRTIIMPRASIRSSFLR